MTTAKLRTVGGSTVVAIPPGLLEELGLSANDQVEIRLEGGSLVIRSARCRYTLDQLMDQCDLTKPASKAQRDWQSAPPVGEEEL